MKKIMCIFVMFAVIFSLCTAEHINADENESPLTRLESVHLLSQLLTHTGEGEVFADTDDKTAAYLHKAGIIQGVGDNKFEPDKPMLVQDFLVTLKRVLERECPDLFYNNQKVRWYYDQNDISEYAQSHIRFLSTVDIYDEDGFLEPLSKVTNSSAHKFLAQAGEAIKTAPKSVNGQAFKEKPPILMYHVIDYPQNDNAYLFVTPEDFEKQIKYMYDNGYTFLFPEELSLSDSVSNPVVITFDDGYEQTYTNAYRILKKYNAKATLYIYSDIIGEEGYCNSTQIRQMSDSSVFRIYSHAKTHTDLTQKTPKQIEAEFSESNDKIYNITKREVTSIAYPFGFFNEDVLFQAKRYYKNGFAVNKGRNTMHSITRKTVDGTQGFEDFLKLIR